MSKAKKKVEETPEVEEESTAGSLLDMAESEGLDEELVATEIRKILDAVSKFETRANIKIAAVQKLVGQMSDRVDKVEATAKSIRHDWERRSAEDNQSRRARDENSAAIGKLHNQTKKLVEGLSKKVDMLKTPDTALKPMRTQLGRLLHEFDLEKARVNGSFADLRKELHSWVPHYRHKGRVPNER